MRRWAVVIGFGLALAAVAALAGGLAMWAAYETIGGVFMAFLTGA